MKTTVNGIIIQLTEEQKAFLNDLMNRYCAAIRWSFKRLLDGWKTQEIRLGVQGRFKLNSRQANDAVYDAQATISSQKELLKLNYANATKKVEFTQKRLDKANSPKKESQSSKTSGQRTAQAGLLAETPGRRYIPHGGIWNQEAFHRTLQR